MANDYIPRSDADFNTWQDNFITNLQTYRTSFGMSSDELTPLISAQTHWTQAYAANTAARSAADAAMQFKKQAREDYEQAIRLMARRIQSLGTVPDSARAALGLTIPQGTRTPAGVPDTRPVAQVDTSQRLRHTITFTDETTPTSLAKPDGVMGCEIWVKVGNAAPADDSELRFLGLDTRSPYTAEYDGGDAGKTAYYMLRWVNGKGEQGPWSQTVSATVTA
jgi:hypothetical protein